RPNAASFVRDPSCARPAWTRGTIVSSTGVGTLVEPLTEEQIKTLPLYEWDIAQIGDSAPPLELEITAERIANYCLAVRNTNPIYTDPEAARKGPFGEIVAPPA